MAISLYIRASKLIQLPAENLNPLTTSPYFSTPQPLTTTFLLSDSMSLAFLKKTPHVSCTMQNLSFSVWQEALI